MSSSVSTFLQLIHSFFSFEQSPGCLAEKESKGEMGWNFIHQGGRMRFSERWRGRWRGGETHPPMSITNESINYRCSAGKHRTHTVSHSGHPWLAIPVHSIPIRHTHAHTSINHGVNHALAEKTGSGWAASSLCLHPELLIYGLSSP